MDPVKAIATLAFSKIEIESDGTNAGTKILLNGKNIVGLATFVATVALTPNTNYIFDCVAQVSGGTGVTAYQFPLRAGLQRP